MRFLHIKIVLCNLKLCLNFFEKDQQYLVRTLSSLKQSVGLYVFMFIYQASAICIGKTKYHEKKIRSNARQLIAKQL